MLDNFHNLYGTKWKPLKMVTKYFEMNYDCLSFIAKICLATNSICSDWYLQEMKETRNSIV